MSFSLNLTQFLNTVKTPEPEGLDLAIEAIDDVIGEIEHQMTVLDPQRFAAEGTIQRVSFGGADSAPNLALHYSRAHEVTWKTMDGLKKDLVAFQDACRAAKDQVIRADEDSAQVLHHTQEAVDTLEAGSASGQSSYAHQQAQQQQDTTQGADA